MIFTPTFPCLQGCGEVFACIALGFLKAWRMLAGPESFWFGLVLPTLNHTSLTQASFPCQALWWTFPLHQLQCLQGVYHPPFLKTWSRTDDRVGERICQNHCICSVAQTSGASLCYISLCPTESALNWKGKGSASLIFNHRPKLRYMACSWGRGGSPFIHLFNEQMLLDCLSHAYVCTPYSVGCSHELEWRGELVRFPSRNGIGGPHAWAAPRVSVYTLQYHFVITPRVQGFADENEYSGAKSSRFYLNEYTKSKQNPLQ